jgi:hypothetical protein
MRVQMMTAIMLKPTVSAMVRPKSGSRAPVVSTKPVQSNCAPRGVRGHKGENKRRAEA